MRTAPGFSCPFRRPLSLDCTELGGGYVEYALTTGLGLGKKARPSETSYVEGNFVKWLRNREL